MKLKRVQTINRRLLITNAAIVPVLIISFAVSAQTFYKIPKQSIYPYKILGTPSLTAGYQLKKETQETFNNFKMELPAFELSAQITFKEYKKYLNSVKTDSSEKFYLSQFPDSSILPSEDYKKYITNPDYEKYPVAGISWNNALNYCRWKTISESKNDSISCIYRLPVYSEWLCAYDFLNKSKIKNDLSKNYSDWTLSAYEEAAYDFTSDSVRYFSYDFVFADILDNRQRVMIRKRFIGDSYFFQKENLIDGYGYGYADTGYKYAAFRMVKARLDKKISIGIYRKEYRCGINILRKRVNQFLNK